MVIGVDWLLQLNNWVILRWCFLSLQSIAACSLVIAQLLSFYSMVNHLFYVLLFSFNLPSAIEAHFFNMWIVSSADVFLTKRSPFHEL